MSIHVFLGSTLAPETARARLRATYLPPARRGDIEQVLAWRPQAIAIIDAVVEPRLAVGCEEVVAALSAGVPVFGAGGVGAAIAAKLAPWGMTGVGEVFRRFRESELVEPEEAAVLGAGDGRDDRRRAVALVTVRDHARRALTDGVLSASGAARIVESAQHLHYAARWYPRILAGALALGAGEREIARFEGWLSRAGRDLPARDALDLLQQLRVLERCAVVPVVPARTAAWRIAALGQEPAVSGGSTRRRAEVLGELARAVEATVLAPQPLQVEV